MLCAIIHVVMTVQTKFGHERGKFTRKIVCLLLNSDRLDLSYGLTAVLRQNCAPLPLLCSEMESYCLYVANNAGS